MVWKDEIPDTWTFPLTMTILDILTGGKGQYTQWVHCELIVGSETIFPAHTQQANGEHFQKVPTYLSSPNPAGKK